VKRLAVIRSLPLCGGGRPSTVARERRLCRRPASTRFGQLQELALRLYDEIHLNLDYSDRWFCRLDLGEGVPDHSTFSKNRHGRFRQSDALPHLFEGALRRCMNERPVAGEAFVCQYPPAMSDAPSSLQV
jgi:transposase-like protein DUF772